MKQIKLSDTHYIVVDDSKIEEGAVWYNASTGLWWKVTADNVAMYNQRSDMDRSGLNKITHSTKPIEQVSFLVGEDEPAFNGFTFDTVKQYPLSLAKEIAGEVNELLIPFPNERFRNGGEIGAWMKGWEVGYKQCLEDNKDKKYTDADIKKALLIKHEGLTDDYIIQSLQPTTEWEVEIIDGKLTRKK